ncbi:hypothetical protein [Actinomadura sp. 6N118]|uniref:hypothetical protein n=1 Tax=Actinomadura sp. 6N118 TaxID=3375151 RepID=UPI0037A3C96B
MASEPEQEMSAERREDIGKAVWAFMRLLEVVPVVRCPMGLMPPPESPTELAPQIAAYGSIIERAAARQREREEERARREDQE